MLNPKRSTLKIKEENLYVSIDETEHNLNEANKAVDRVAALKLLCLMQYLSDYCYMAGWAINLEFEVWEIVQEDSNTSHELGFQILDPETINLIESLAEKSGGFWIHKDHNLQFIPLNEWRKLFNSCTIEDNKYNIELNSQTNQIESNFTEDNLFVFIWQHRIFAFFTLVFFALPLVIFFGEENIAEVSDIILRRMPEMNNMTKYINLCGIFAYTLFTWSGVIMFRKSLDVSGKPGSIASSFSEIFFGCIFLLSPFWFSPILDIALYIMI